MIIIGSNSGNNRRGGNRTNRRGGNSNNNRRGGNSNNNGNNRRGGNSNIGRSNDRRNASSTTSKKRREGQGSRLTIILRGSKDRRKGQGSRSKGQGSTKRHGRTSFHLGQGLILGILSKIESKINVAKKEEKK